jgi:metallo-beta-lactamase family protein
MKIDLSFFGGVGRATGANILLSFNSKKILVDCGLIQGDREADLLNHKEFAYDTSSIDFLFVTHAHMDHIGRIT